MCSRTSIIIFPVYLVRDTGYRGSELTTQRGSRCSISWPDLFWLLHSLTGCIFASESGRILLMHRNSPIFDVPLPFYISILEDLILKICISIKAYLQVLLGPSGSCSKFSIWKATSSSVGRKKNRFSKHNSQLLY